MLTLETYQILIAEFLYALISIMVSQGVWNFIKQSKEKGRPGTLKLILKKMLGPVLFYGLGFLGGVLTIILFTVCQ